MSVSSAFFMKFKKVISLVGSNREGERHAHEVEEKRSGILQGVLDQDEGCAPDEHGGEEKQVRDSGRA